MVKRKMQNCVYDTLFCIKAEMRNKTRYICSYTVCIKNSIFKKTYVSHLLGMAGNWVGDISSRSGTSWCIILYIV